VVPEFLGNRAPLADPHAKAIIAGLGMERDLDNLMALYVAGLCGIGYGLRQIIDARRPAGSTARISSSAAEPGSIRWCASCWPTPADERGEYRISEPVLLGSAILGAVAGQIPPSLPEAMKQFTRVDKTYRCVAQYSADHQRRYEAYKTLQHTARLIRE
jgi:ribulose kinase